MINQYVQSFNDTAYEIVRSLWGSRNSWLGVTWNANQMSPPNFYVLFIIYVRFSTPLLWSVITHRIIINAPFVHKIVFELLKLFHLVGCISFIFLIFSISFAVSGTLPGRSVSGSLPSLCQDVLSLELCRDAPFMPVLSYHIFNNSLLCIKPLSYLVKSCHD